MEWTAKTGGRRLRRIVALLLALAVLADRAGGASFPVRFIVLSILRCAEAIAWEFIAGAARAPSRTASASPLPYSRAEAARFALGLRMLALVVAELAAEAPARVPPGRLRDFAPAGARPIAHAPAALRAHDTS